MKTFAKACVLILASLLLTTPLVGQGKVYFVLGSDTAIWDGMDVALYHPTYTLTLFTDPLRNGYAVMDPAFRNSMTDSYGQTVKFTWWMMMGNIFRRATNDNIPLANTMTLYLMKKYHGEAVRAFGDELSTHYHTFVWSDYDGDGKPWWNEAHSFTESREDFDVTLAEALLEENHFPVSFRSGWHYMDNDWQRYLDSLLPFSMHNDWPAKRTTTVEPIDNVYDWSQAPSTWIPFHPSLENYQVPGDAHGWELRSKHIGSIDSTIMEQIFVQAANGTDQVACFWGHLPETDFLDNMQKINRLAHEAAARHPAVTFRYCTAVEAMQRWLGTHDTTAPALTVSEIPSGNQEFLRISSDEPLFQPAPFVALKTVDGQYSVVRCAPSGSLQWETALLADASTIAKIGIAVTDTVGNQTLTILRHLPDDQYVDNADSGYAETRGSWSTIATTVWGTDSRVASIAGGDSAKASWSFPVSHTGYYHVSLKMPPVSAPPTSLVVRLLEGTDTLVVRSLDQAPTSTSWLLVSTVALNEGSPLRVELTGVNAGSSTVELGADAAKISPLVRARELAVLPASVALNDINLGDTVRTTITLENRGYETLHVNALSSQTGAIRTETALPLALAPASSGTIAITFVPGATGQFLDTISLATDDSFQPITFLPLSADVHLYLALIDNQDSAYAESGTWYTSNAQAYGPSSRYAYITSIPAPSARYAFTLRQAGEYAVEEIVPNTENASLKALYILEVGGHRVDSVTIDQNASSGTWVKLMNTTLPAGNAAVIIRDAGGSDATHAVLRADAVRFELVTPAAVASEIGGVPNGFQLYQNYPNPFNPTTMIEYTIAGGRSQGSGVSEVRMVIYDLLGREVAVLVNGQKSPGTYSVAFDGSKLASGVYICRLTAGSFSEARQMLLLR